MSSFELDKESHRNTDVDPVEPTKMIRGLRNTWNRDRLQKWCSVLEGESQSGADVLFLPSTPVGRCRKDRPWLCSEVHGVWLKETGNSCRKPWLEIGKIF